MSFVLYLLVSGLAVALTTRALRAEVRTRQTWDFAVLGALTALTYSAFALYLAAGQPWARVFYAAVGTLLPIANLRFLDHFFPAPEGAGPSRDRMMGLSFAVAAAYFTYTVIFGGPDPRPGPREVALGALVFCAFAATLAQLVQRYRRSNSPQARARILYLGLFFGGAVAFTGLEGFNRIAYGGDPSATAGLGAQWTERQGVLPPVGAMLTGLYFFFLYLVLQAQRLLDLKEIVTRIVTVTLSGALFTGLLGLAALWRPVTVGELGGILQATWMSFVTAVLFLIGYEPLRVRLEAVVGPWVNQRGAQLAVTLTDLERTLPTFTSVRELVTHIVDELYSSGGLPAASFYLYDASSQQFRLLHARHGEGPDPLLVVAPRPFVLGFEAGQVNYQQAELARIAPRSGPEVATRVQLLQGMDAELVVPLYSGRAVLGWLALRDEAGSDGFSREEQSRLARLMARMAISVENIKGFEASREQARLAALGTMSAGLAHEIRNPLAGLKGAAQVLLTLNPSEDQREFIEIITDETDRLNKVVTSFLDYARPLVLDRAPTDLHQLITQVLQLVRAQSLPAAVNLVEPDPEPKMMAWVDGDKLRQVVLNLVQNAVHAVASGGEVRVSVQRLTGPDPELPPRVEIRVEDTGAGLAAEVQDSLFIPFVTTKSQGTGLGLAICQRIVKAHDGEIRVESSPGAGARFIVLLPEAMPPA